jgi:hypothetical protein
VGSEFHAKAGPRIEVITHGDGSGTTFALADRPELLEGRGALDGRSVGTLVGVDIVNTTIRGHRPFLGRTSAWVVRSKAFYDIIFNQGVPL